MNEQELRDGLRGAMAASSQPPPMNVNSALDHARSAHKRRRASWAGAGVSLAVVALAAGAVVVFNAPEPTGSIPVDLANQTGTTTTQIEKTQTTGPQATQAQRLLGTLKTALPDTLTIDQNASTTQASRQNHNGTDVWEYLAIAMVTAKSSPGTGRVFATVHSPGYVATTDVCELAKLWWGSGGVCQTVTKQGKQVGLIANTNDRRTDSVAAYRYEDGTVVYIAQSRDPNNNRSDDTVPPGGLNAPPMSTDQLTDLVVNPAFKTG